jgi:hypothetical protein
MVKNLAMLALLASAAQASLVTSDTATGVKTTWTSTGSTSAPSMVVNGINITSNGLVWTGAGYGLASNGSWNQSAVATNDATTYIQFNLGGAATMVEAFMNYAPGFGTPTISAIGSDGVTVLESYNLLTSAVINTPAATNGGAYRGIQRSQGDIYYFRISGAYIITSNIEISNVPEPGTMALSGAGLVLLGLVTRRRKA